MPNFKIVADPSKIPIHSGWIDSNKFYCKNRIVDKRGREVTRGYEGNQYKIIEKKEFPFSTLERVGRGLLGMIAVISTLSFALLSSSVWKLFTKSQKKIRFAISYPPPPDLPNQQGRGSPPPEIALDLVEANPHSDLSQALLQEPEESMCFEKQLPFSEKALQEGISISDEAIQEVRQCVEKFFKREVDRSVKFYKSQRHHWVFSLTSIPGLIFKMNPGGGSGMSHHYQNMIRAETIIRVNQLRSLVIPRAKLLRIEEYEILVQKELHFDPQRQERHLQDEWIHEPLLELAKFVCDTGYSRVGWRNNPILTNKKIGLIDLQEMDSAEYGLFGKGLERRGLVGCVNEEQGKMIEAVAKEKGVSTTSFETTYARREKELAWGRKVREYYKAKKIVDGDERIQVDESALNFPVYPDAEERLKRLALDVIQVINEKISKSSTEQSIEKRRCIRINTNSEPFVGMDAELVARDEDLVKTTNGFKTEQEYYDVTFLGCVLKKLADLEIFYKAVKEGCWWHIQA